MQITAEMVKNLRDATGAGMMDCKKALTEAGGDIKEAEKILKKMGLAAVAKRADRATECGKVTIKSNNEGASIVTLSCETDFVARNEEFIALGDKLADYALSKKLNAPTDEMKKEVEALISTIKENMSVKSVIYIPLKENERVEGYLHMGGVLGVAVKFQACCADAYNNDKIKDFMHSVALHVAAFHPLYLSDKTVDDAYKNEQLEIFNSQVASLDKPEKVKAGIVQGKLKKLYDEVCLLSQAFVKDDSMSVSAALTAVCKETGFKLDITDYWYVEA